MKLRKVTQQGAEPTFSFKRDIGKLPLEMAIAAIREASKRATDELFPGSNVAARDWAIESLLQGAFLREYHVWETETKEYFNIQHDRNGRAKVNWKKQDNSCGHVSKVK